MADSITWLLNADASQVRAEMQSAMVAANTGTGQIVNGFNNADIAHGHLLASNKKVTTQIGHFTQSMLYGADATSLATDAFIGLSKILKLPLLPLASLVVGGIAIKSVIDYRNEWKKVNDELDKAAKTRPANRTSEEVKKDAEATTAAITKATEKIEGEGMWGKIKRWAGNIGSVILDPQTGGGMNWKTGRASQPVVPGHEIQDPKSQAEKKIEKAREAQAKDAEDLAKLEHEKLVTAQADRLKSSLQLSLADIAKEGVHRKTGTFDNSRLYGGDVAQEAIKEQMAARKAMLAQDYAGAIQHQSRAEELKGSLPALKDSEKIVAELVASHVTLKEIREKVTFTNQ